MAIQSKRLQTTSPLKIIKPQRGWVDLNLQELWDYRELFLIFSWRDMRVRYRQTLLGVVWVVLQPFILMVVFSVFFGKLANISSNGVPYPVFVFSGLLFWNYFQMAVTNASNSVVESENILKKIYFPRLFLPFSATITPLIDFGISLIIFFGLVFFYKYTPGLIGIALLPLLLLLTFLSAAGLGFIFSATNVKFRDIRFIIPFFIQILFFITPVIYPTNVLPEHYRWLLALNPMTGIIETARAGIVGHQPINFHYLLISAVVAVGLFFFGLFYFKRVEQVFADVA